MDEQYDGGTAIVFSKLTACEGHIPADTVCVGTSFHFVSVSIVALVNWSVIKCASPAAAIGDKTLRVTQERKCLLLANNAYCRSLNKVKE